MTRTREKQEKMLDRQLQWLAGKETIWHYYSTSLKLKVYKSNLAQHHIYAVFCCLSVHPIASSEIVPNLQYFCRSEYMNDSACRFTVLHISSPCGLSLIACLWVINQWTASPWTKKAWISCTMGATCSLIWKPMQEELGTLISRPLITGNDS